jgi:hypothetical protein
MNIVLSKKELEKLKTELNAPSNKEVEQTIMETIPLKYRGIVGFQTLPSGTLCINIDDKATLALYKEFNQRNYSNKLKKIFKEVDAHKSTLLLKMPTLAVTLTSTKKKFFSILDMVTGNK